MSDSITQNFRQLGVPLVNQQWSWGASNEKAVVLRVWLDHARLDGNDTLNALVWQDGWAKDPSGRTSPGGTERLRQLDEIEAGKPCYVVIITDRWGGNEDPKRSITSSANRPIFRAGALHRDPNGNVWVELLHWFKDINETTKEIASLKPHVADVFSSVSWMEVINPTVEPPVEDQRATFYRVYDHFLRMDDFDWEVKYKPFETFLHKTKMICEWPVVGITKDALARLQENNWELKREIVHGHAMSQRERGRRLFGNEDRVPYDKAFDFYYKNNETILVLAKGENGKDVVDHWSEVIPLPQSLFGWRTAMAVYLRKDRKQYLQKLAAEHRPGVAV